MRCATQPFLLFQKLEQAPSNGLLKFDYVFLQKGTELPAVNCLASHRVTALDLRKYFDATVSLGIQPASTSHCDFVSDTSRFTIAEQGFQRNDQVNQAIR